VWAYGRGQTHTQTDRQTDRQTHRRTWLQYIVLSTTHAKCNKVMDKGHTTTKACYYMTLWCIINATCYMLLPFFWHWYFASYCSDTFEVLWDILLRTYAKFIAKSGSERILKIVSALSTVKGKSRVTRIVQIYFCSDTLHASYTNTSSFQCYTKVWFSDTLEEYKQNKIHGGMITKCSSFFSESQCRTVVIHWRQST